MSSGKDISVIATGLAALHREDVVSAMQAEGWNVKVAEDLQELVYLATSGDHHLAVIACEDPRLLQSQDVRTLLSLRIGMSTIFLVPDACETAECPTSIIGITSDQIRRIGTSMNELMDIFRYELNSILANSHEYTVILVDDDQEFLRSMKAFLPHRLRESLPRFNLNFECFTSPKEVLDNIRRLAAAHLAVVICDQVMPEMDGIDLLKQIRARCPHAKCALLTGQATLDSAIKAINEQVLDKYFSKPIEQPADFANEIRHLLHDYYSRVVTKSFRHCLAAQTELIRTINVTRDIEDTISVVVDIFHKQMQTDRVILALVDYDRLVIRAGFGLPNELPIGAAVPENGVFEWVLERRQPVYALTDKDLPAGITPQPYLARPVMALPLVWGDSLLGVILIAGRAETKPFTRVEQVLMSFLADTVSVSVCGFSRSVKFSRLSQV
ncbi:MAG: response regulator [Sedimentisphaerales bacterium]|nr:response regulator [Sedimentisphaerales bacterium]